MIRCSRCVLPDTRPDTAFVDGVCSACIAYEQRPTIDWADRLEQLRKLLDRHDGRCIVPSSGGKDSTFQVLKLLELGATPIVVTATTCHLTPVGRRNIENLKRWATTIEVSPNAAVRAKLNRIGLLEVGDISWPEHVSIFTTPFKVAARFDIPLIFYGENPQNQYGGPLDSQAAVRMTARWVSEFGGFLGLRPQDLVGVQGLTERDLEHYLLPPAAELDVLGIEAHFLGQYIPWNSHENARVAIAAGMHVPAEPPCRANFWNAENLDNAQTGIHDHGMYRKYGFGRGAAQLAVDVRAGRLPRKLALDWIREGDGLFPWMYAGVTHQEVISRIGVSDTEFARAIARFTNRELFAGEREGRPILKEFA